MPSDRNAEARRTTIERHIDEARTRIERFRGLVAQTASRGGDTVVGERILSNMERAVGTLEETWRANGGLLHEVKEQSVQSLPPDTDRWHRLVDESQDAVASLRRVRNSTPR